MGIGDWGLGIGDWGFGDWPNPQSPIPNPQSPIPNKTIIFYFLNIQNLYLKYDLFKNLRKNKFYLYNGYFMKLMQYVPLCNYLIVS